MRRRFMVSAGSDDFIPGIYVSLNGTGDGSRPSQPMSLANFLLLTLVDGDKVFFKAGDEF